MVRRKKSENQDADCRLAFMFLKLLTAQQPAEDRDFREALLSKIEQLCRTVDSDDDFSEWIKMIRYRAIAALVELYKEHGGPEKVPREDLRSFIRLHLFHFGRWVEGTDDLHAHVSLLSRGRGYWKELAKKCSSKSAARRPARVVRGAPYDDFAARNVDDFLAQSRHYLASVKMKETTYRNLKATFGLEVVRNKQGYIFNWQPATKRTAAKALAPEKVRTMHRQGALARAVLSEVLKLSRKYSDGEIEAGLGRVFSSVSAKRGFKQTPIRWMQAE